MKPDAMKAYYDKFLKLSNAEINAEVFKVKLPNGYATLIDWDDRELMDWFTWWGAKDKHVTYVRAQICRKGVMHNLSLHRLIMSAGNGMVVDHINRNGLDNRRINLRVCSATENKRNAKASNGCVSGFKGVCWNKDNQKWQACISLDGKKIWLGYHATEIGAAIAYDKAALKYHSKFAWTNQANNAVCWKVKMEEVR